MAEVIELKVKKSIANAAVLSTEVNCAGQINSSGEGQMHEDRMSRQYSMQIAQVENLGQILNGLVSAISDAKDNFYNEYKKSIAELAVGISDRILGKRIEVGDYDITEIAAEAIGSVSGKENLTVHVNPEDLAILQSCECEAFKGIEFVADAHVGKAECSVKTNRGTIERHVEESLIRIAKGLEEL